MTSSQSVSNSTNYVDILSQQQNTVPKQDYIPALHTENKDSVELSNQPKKKINSKTLKIAAAITAAAAAITGAIYAIKKGKFSDIDKLAKLASETKIAKGNNEILDELVVKSKQVVGEMTDGNKEHYKELLENLKGLIKPLKPESMPEGGIVYHGTSIDNASSIIKDGITPFTKNARGRELGSAVYSTGNLDVSKLFSKDGGVILPYKLNAQNVAEINQENYQKIINHIATFCDAHLADSSYPELFGKELKKSDPNAFLKILNTDKDVIASLTNKIFKDLGYDAAYSDRTLTAGMNLNFSPFSKPMSEMEKETGLRQSQFAIFDGSKLELVPNLIKEINQK